MKLSDKQFDQAVQISNDVIDFVWDDESDEVSALACLMASVPYLLDAGCTKGEACRLLKILMSSFGDKDGTTKQ
jgi:hypothetical protein